MEKHTDKDTYDPMTAESLGSITSFYKEGLYQTKSGRYFLYYDCPASSVFVWGIKPLTENEAKDWVWDNIGPGKYIEIFE